MGVASQPCGHFLASRCGRTADHAALGSVRRGGAEAAGRSVSALICRPPARRQPLKDLLFPTALLRALGASSPDLLRSVPLVGGLAVPAPQSRVHRRPPQPQAQTSRPGIFRVQGGRGRR